MSKKIKFKLNTVKKVERPAGQANQYYSVDTENNEEYLITKQAINGYIGDLQDQILEYEMLLDEIEEKD